MAATEEKEEKTLHLFSSSTILFAEDATMGILRACYRIVNSSNVASIQQQYEAEQKKYLNTCYQSLIKKDDPFVLKLFQPILTNAELFYKHSHTVYCIMLYVANICLDVTKHLEWKQVNYSSLNAFDLTIRKQVKLVLTKLEAKHRNNFAHETCQVIQPTLFRENNLHLNEEQNEWQTQAECDKEAQDFEKKRKAKANANVKKASNLFRSMKPNELKQFFDQYKDILGNNSLIRSISDDKIKSMFSDASEHDLTNISDEKMKRMFFDVSEHDLASNNPAHNHNLRKQKKKQKYRQKKKKNKKLLVPNSTINTATTTTI